MKRPMKAFKYVIIHKNYTIHITWLTTYGEIFKISASVVSVGLGITIYILFQHCLQELEKNWEYKYTYTQQITKNKNNPCNFDFCCAIETMQITSKNYISPWELFQILRTKIIIIITNRSSWHQSKKQKFITFSSLLY